MKMADLLKLFKQIKGEMKQKWFSPDQVKFKFICSTWDDNKATDKYLK